MKVEIRHQVFGGVFECRQMFVAPVGKDDLSVLMPRDVLQLYGLQEIHRSSQALLQLGNCFLSVFHARRIHCRESRSAILRMVRDTLYLHMERELIENKLAL